MRPQDLSHHVRSGCDIKQGGSRCAITHSSINSLHFPPRYRNAKHLDSIASRTTHHGITTACHNPLTTDTGRRSVRIPSMPVSGTYPQYPSIQISIPTATATRHMYPGRATTLTQTPVITSRMILISPLEVLLREVADPDLRVGSLDREIRGSVIGSKSFPAMSA